MAAAVEASPHRQGPPGVNLQTEQFAMPKMKSKKSAAKRFKVRGSGSIKRSSAYMRHILTKKSTKRKRQLRGTTNIDQTNKRQILSMLPYAK
jgi:large subunit ribosomal protein L35